jgi:UDP-N-acetylglucosamine 2-epimerase (non-hydrolysing)
MHILVTCHRRENWGLGLQSLAAALRELALSEAVDIACVLHPNPNAGEKLRRLLKGVPTIRLVPSCGHEELVAQMRDADLILSDSGGMQEEAPALGIPLLVLRDKTERPEAIATGNARLVGTDAPMIVAEVRRLLRDPLARAAMSRTAFPFGDGRSAERIAAAIERWLDQRNAFEPRVSSA